MKHAILLLSYGDWWSVSLLYFSLTAHPTNLTKNYYFPIFLQVLQAVHRFVTSEASGLTGIANADLRNQVYDAFIKMKTSNTVRTSICLLQQK